MCGWLLTAVVVADADAAAHGNITDARGFRPIPPSALPTLGESEGNRERGKKQKWRRQY